MDQELDQFICTNLKITYRPLTVDEMMKILTYYYPGIKMLQDEQTIKDTGCVVLQCGEPKEENSIYISRPTPEKIEQSLYYIVLVQAVAVRDGKDEVEVPKLL
jgi:hypothetical protein